MTGPLAYGPLGKVPVGASIGPATLAKPAARLVARPVRSISSAHRRRVTPAASRLAAGAAALLLALALGGCGADGASRPDAAGRIQACKAGDQRVPSESACLQDDAACYALANGDWCTGERGNTCPAGSSALPAGAPCPPGARCFRIGESLECAI